MEISKELSKKVLDGIIKLITTDHETVEDLRKETGDDIANIACPTCSAANIGPDFL